MSKTKKQIFAPLSAPFRFLGSLALGIFLLAVLLVLMAMGTFIEAEYGAAVAKFVVYAHPGFYALLALLALNLVVSIILRFPWRLRQISFLIAHVGILLLLFGCYRT
ncbi:MAG: hypothetical protein LBI05_10370, partial [Planctomycetaceae bacterium]|nr:hypothetical protein [Planctomycetaceae bacterium]